MSDADARLPRDGAAGSKGRLLLVEDDQALTELLRWHFERAGFEVIHTPDGEDALALAKRSPPTVVLLDWMIEGISGIEVCRRLRRTPELARLPIIMITARSDEADRLHGFETGADDYVTKPFSPRELLARVDALLRRGQSPEPTERLRFSDVEMNLANHRVRRAGRNVRLGPTDFRLLRFLMENPRRVFSRERLLAAVWGRDHRIDERTVDVHMRRLRQALSATGESPLIRTVREAGYALDDEAA